MPVRIFSHGLALLALTLTSLASQAGVVTLAGCPSCDGGAYTLTYGGTPLADSDPLRETFRVTLTMDTSGVVAAVPSAAALDTAALKLAPAIRALALVSAPGALSDWALLDGTANGQGCSGGAGGGFVCADWVGPGLGATLGGLLSFTFDLTVDNGALFTGDDAAAVKGRFVDSAGRKAGALLSNPITLGSTALPAGGDAGFELPPPPAPVPEPALPALLATALLAATLALRARPRQAARRHPR